LADSLIFINPSYQTCYIETTAINNQEIGNVLYYNNTLKTLVFEIDCISPIELIIVDTMGRVVLTKKLNTYQNNIDLSFLPNGFYMVNISGTNYQNNLKFFKK
ncbi:MAG TPA: T9SS type A sorting domain-containing protein, partial [Paludibacteraceae bacterium]|nr:T9SS type A sorting domain-containing protein [Paludibacteraceae bacterium]